MNLNEFLRGTEGNHHHLNASQSNASWCKLWSSLLHQKENFKTLLSKCLIATKQFELCYNAGTQILFLTLYPEKRGIVTFSPSSKSDIGQDLSHMYY